MVKQPRIMGVGEFRQQATRVINEVEGTAQPVIISRHGKPVVEIRPLAKPASDLLDSVTVADDVDLTAPVIPESEWSATR